MRQTPQAVTRSRSSPGPGGGRAGPPGPAVPQRPAPVDRAASRAWIQRTRGAARTPARPRGGMTGPPGRDRSRNGRGLRPGASGPTAGEPAPGPRRRYRAPKETAHARNDTQPDRATRPAGTGINAVVWIEPGRALVVRGGEGGEPATLELRHPRRAGATPPALAEIAHRIGDVDRVLVLGDDELRTALEREIVAIGHRPETIREAVDRGAGRRDRPARAAAPARLSPASTARPDRAGPSGRVLGSVGSTARRPTALPPPVTAPGEHETCGPGARDPVVRDARTGTAARSQLPWPTRCRPKRPPICPILRGPELVLVRRRPATRRPSPGSPPSRRCGPSRRATRSPARAR